MACGTRQRGRFGLLLVLVGCAGLLCGSAFAADEPAEEKPTPTTQPTTKPAKSPTTDKAKPSAEEVERELRERIERLRQIREARAASQPTTSSSQPTTAPKVPKPKPRVTTPGPRTRAARAPSPGARPHTRGTVRNQTPSNAQRLTKERNLGDDDPMAKLEELRRMRDAAGERPTRQPPRTTPGPKPTPTRNIPATSPEDTVVIDQAENIADGDGENWFQYEGAAWEDVIVDFARRLGKPLMNLPDIIIGGELTYLSERTFTKEEAIDELNFLLHEKGYHFVEERDRIRVVPTMEMSIFVSLDRVYDSVAEFTEDNLRDMEYAIVYARVEGKNAQTVVDLLGTNLPDDVMLSVFGETNKVKVSGVARDIRRFLEIKELVETGKFDPRDTEIIPIKNNVRTIESMVGKLFGAGGGGNRRYNPQTRKWETTGGTDSNLEITADDRTNTLIVRGMPDEIQEIKELLQKIDEQPDIGEFVTKVVEIKYASASEVANLLNQIFAQEQGQSSGASMRSAAMARARAAAAARNRGRNTRTPTPQPPAGGSTPADIMGEGVFERAKKTIRIVAFERTNSIAVYANEEGHGRVAEMLKEIDLPQPTNFNIIELENVDVNEIYPTVAQLVSDLTSVGRSGMRRTTVQPDPVKNVLYVMAERDVLQSIRDIVSELDKPMPEKQRHIVMLENIAPSQMMQLIQSMLGGEGGTPIMRRSSRGRRTTAVGAAQTTSGVQMIPLDASQTLIVVCNDEDWVEIQEIIQIGDAKAVTNDPQLRTFEIEHGNAQSIVGMLRQFYRRYERAPFPPTPVLIHNEDNKVYVQAIKPALEEIEALVLSMDVESSEDDVVILPLEHADASQVANHLVTILGGSVRRGRGAVSTGPSIQAEPVTNSLIVQASANDLERIKKFADDIDAKVAAQMPEQKFITLRYAQPQQVANAVAQMFTSGAGGGRGGSRMRGAAVGTRVKAVASGKQLIVEAPESVMAEVENFVAQLDDPKGGEIIIKTIKLAGSDVATIASKLSGAFREKSRTQSVVARFDADPTSETILLTCSKDVQEEIEGLIAEYVEAGRGMINQTEFYQLTHAEAADAARWLSDQLTTAMRKQYGRNVVSQIKVSPDTRTNRVIINAPQVAVEAGKALLLQYDVVADKPPAPVMETHTYKLTGLDVGTLARNLTTQFVRNRPRRPDRLQAAFSGDQITETLMVSAPPDMFEEIDEVIGQFVEESKDLVAEQQFIDIKNADANYIASQLDFLLKKQVESQRGRAVANRISIRPEQRMNRIVINAPKFVIPMADALVEKLDQVLETPRELIQTIPLTNADANVIVGVLNNVLRNEMRTNRNLSVTAEGLTNSLIVTADKETFEQIKEWAERLDEAATNNLSETRIFKVSNANPWEVVNLLNSRFVPRGWGRRQQTGKEISFAVVAGMYIVANAPGDKMPEIEAYITEVDQIIASKLEVRTYQLTGIGDQINEFARDVQNAVNKKITGQSARERQVTITPYAAADTLVVTALSDQFEDIEAMMDTFKGLFEGETLVTFDVKLEHLRPSQAAPMLSRMVANKVTKVSGRGRRATQNFSVEADDRTNRVFITAPEKIVEDVREVLVKIDVPPETIEGELRSIPLVAIDPQIVVQTLSPIYRTKAQQKRNDASYIPVQLMAEAITNSLLVIAGEEDFEQIKSEAVRIDEAMVEGEVKPVKIELKYADPGEMQRTITTIFGTGGRGRGKTQSITQEVVALVANNSLIVKAPPAKLKEIRELVASIDAEDTNQLDIRTYDLKVLNAEMVARQVNAYLMSISRTLPRGAMKPAAFAEPTTNTLVVMAPAEDFTFIDGLVKKIESMPVPVAIPEMHKLEYARAQQVAEPVRAMLQAKVAEKAQSGRRGSVPVEVQADDRTNMLMIFAPEEYQDLARELIAMVDRDEETGEIVHIITLEQSDATEMADTLSQIVSGTSTGGFSPYRRGGRRGGRGGVVAAGGSQVTIVPDAGSNSLVLKGLPRDVAEVESLIEEIESKGSSIPELQIFRLEYATAYDVEEVLKANFPATRGATDSVSITSDEFSNRLIITASRRKMRMVEAYIAQLDAAPPETESIAALPRGQQLYFVDIYRGDAWDIAWDVSMMLPDNGPTVDADVFGEYIKVICRPSEKDQIVDLIRQFEARAKEEKTVVIRKLKGNSGQVISAIQAQYPENMIEEGDVPDFPIDNMIIDVWPEGKEPPVYRRKQREHEEGRQTRRGDVLPMMLDEAALGAMRNELEALINEAEDPTGAAEAPRLAAAQDRAFGSRSADRRDDAESDREDNRIKAPQKRERAKITIMPDGRAVISGPSSDVDKLTDAIDLLEEDLGVGEVVRIFRFKYGDVNAAAEVLDRMFNERQVQIPQRQQQPQQQRGQRGQQGTQNQQNLMEQMRQMMGQQQQRGRSAGGTRVRIATDPSRNYIIVKCDESDLDEIQQLLRMLDDIPDVEIKVRIFQLRNLDATETAGNIKEVLGIGSARSPRAAQQTRGRGQQQLMTMLEQQMVSVAGGKGMGAKIESVDIVPNVATNALLVSAPEEVMEVVEDVLSDLEALETRNVVVIRHYPLENAKVDDVLPLLEEIFSEAAGRQTRGKGALPSALGPVMVSGDPRSNTIIFTAESKDVETVERQIASLDIEGMINEAETYICKYGDAQAIAEVVNAVYGNQGASVRRGGRGGRGGQATSSTTEIRIVAEPNTNAIVVWGPLDKREIIFEKIRDFDEQSRNAFQDIDVVHADPEDLAMILGQMFNGTAATTGGSQRGGRGRQAPTSGSGNVVIVGDKNAKKLLVRAPELVFEQIADMVALLDIPDQQLQIRRYVLDYADAQVVKQSLDGALTEFMQVAKATGGDVPEFDAFTVVPDSRTNSLMVVGSAETFTFVESVLHNIDIETPDALRAAFRVFELEVADATVVAEAINNMSSSGSAAQTQSRGRGRNQRGGSSGATIGTGELRVTAIPETATNSVMVFGVSEDIDEVAATVIQPYEDMIRARLEPESIPVNKAKPSQVASFIRQFLGTVGSADSGGRGRNRDSSGTDAPHIVPNDNAGILVVSGTPAQKDRIRMLVEKFDDPILTGGQLKVIQIPWGQDVTALAAQVEQVVNGGEEELARQQQREANRVVVGYDLDANALIINGDPGLFGTADALVQQIVDLAAKTQYETVFIDLKNLTAQDAIELINDLQQQSSGNRSGSQRRTTPQRRGNTPTRRRRGDAQPNFQHEVPGLAPATPMRPILTTCILMPVLSSNFVDEMTDALVREVRGPTAAEASLNLRAELEPAREPRVRAVAAFSRRDNWDDTPQATTRVVAPRRSRGYRTTEPSRARKEAVDSESACLATQPLPQGGGSDRVLGLDHGRGSDQSRVVGIGASAAEPRETRSVLVSASAPREKTWLSARRDVLASIADDDPQPRDPRRRPRSAPRTRSEREPARPRVSAVSASETQPEPTEPTTLPTVTGQLRGDVTAVELDANKIAISGDAADLAFLQQLLLRVDAATPASEIRVFKLERAKATGLVKIIDEAVKSLVEARGTDESFSVTAEARSNSLIVAATMDMLDEIGVIIERLDARGEGEDIKTERIPLNYVRASELKAQLTPVIERLNDIREVPKESQASLEADDRSNSLLIIGTLKDIEEISELVIAYDVDLAEEGERLGVYSEMLIVGLQNGQAADVAKVLTDMIEAEQEAAREAAGAKSPGIPAVRRLQLTAPDGTRLPALDLEKPIRLIPEEGTNSIIVFSTPENNQALTAIVDVFDTLPIGADTDVRAFALKYATAEQVAAVLGEVFENGRDALSRPSESKIDEGQLPPEPPGLAGKGLPYQVALSYDARSNTVIVIGRSDAVLLASGLIQEMDRPSAELGFAIHVIEMKNVQASEIEERLSELLEERAKALGDKGTERDIAVVKADDRSNSLIVIANEDVYQMVDDLVVKLDMAESYRIIDTHFRPLEYADAIKLQRLLEEVFEAKEDASSKTKTETTDTLTVTADARSNSLVLTGTRDYLTEAESLIADLDRGFDPTVVFKVVKVKLNSAANVAKLLKDMVDETLSDQDANLTGAPVHIAADPISDSILLAASQEDMGMIERWIEILDRPSEIGRMATIIPLRRARAEDLAESVDKLFEGTTDNDVDLTVTSDASTNSVVAFGPPALLEDIEDIVRRLDTTEPEARAIVRIFKLEEASAEDAGDLLRDILEGSGGTIGGSGGSGRGSGNDELKQRMLVFQASHPELGERTLQGIRDDIIVTADTRTNSLVITAPIESMPLVESLVTAIDLPPDENQVQVVQLYNSDADQMVEMLNEVFEEQTTGRSSGDDSQREITLTGLGAGGRQEIKFSSDMRTNSVIAVGTKGYLKLAEELIIQLDSVQIDERRSLVYSPRNATVESLVESLSSWSENELAALEEYGDEISTQRKLEREISAIGNEDMNRVILSFDPRRESEVLDIVNQLDQAPPQVSIEVLILEVKSDNTLELGIEFAAQDLQWTNAGPDDTSTFDYVYGTDIGAAGTGLGGFSFTITGRDFNFLLRTLQSESALNVLSRPHIVAMNKQEAKIEITNDTPYVSSTSTSDSGQITTAVNRQDVGIILTVKPTINPDGFVRMEVEQEVSDLTDSTIQVGSGVTSPIFFKRVAQTTVTVKDNETVVLGGLIRAREERTESKIPVVGDVPVLGSLFRYDNDSTERTELLVILTPRIIRSVNDFREVSLAKRDEGEIIPDSVLTHPFMNKLRARPEDLLPKDHDELGPFPADDDAVHEIEHELKRDEYGPLGTMRELRRELNGGIDPESYDLPVTLKTPRAGPR